MKQIYLIIVLVLATTGSSFAQDFCGSDALNVVPSANGQLNYKLQSAYRNGIAQFRADYGTNLNPLQNNEGTKNKISGASGCALTNYIVPVVVHIMHHSSKSVGQESNITDSQVANQLQALNEAFSNKSLNANGINTGIQFVLAAKKPDGSSFNGILRHANDTDMNVPYNFSKIDAYFKRYNLDETQYLNIYVVKNIVDSAGIATAVSGFGTYPANIGYFNQGIMMQYQKFGTSSFGSPIVSGQEGEILVHEMGHFLGLFHPWENTCNGSTATNCATEGDMCCDVAQSSSILNVCDTTSNTCTDSSDYDAVRNYMAYTPDACRSAFTPNQLSIMLYTLLEKRSKLSKPSNINHKNAIGCVWTARFSGDNLICKTENASYEAYQLSGVSYRWKWQKNSSTLYTQLGTYQWNTTSLDTGSYTVSLTVKDSITNDSLTYTYVYPLVVSDCSPMHSTRAQWFFGDHAGLVFNVNGIPIRSIEAKRKEPNNIYSTEGGLSISDSMGKLMFYAGGRRNDASSSYDYIYRVFGSKYSIMDNNIIGDRSSSQAGISLPFHSNPSKHHLITRIGGKLTNTSPLNHNIIDMSITDIIGQKGKLIITNKPILDTSGNFADRSEILTAIKRCDDSTHWIITTDAIKNTMEVYVLSDTGVYFYKRTTIPKSIFDSSHFALKGVFSTDGNWLWLANSLFKFSRDSANIELVWTDTLSHIEVTGFGGCFSPDSRLFYWMDYNSSLQKSLWQGDLYSKDFKSSLRKISTFTNGEEMQLGPDGKIYIALFSSRYLSVINKPNKRVKLLNECDYAASGVLLSLGGDGGQCKSGLPNFMDAEDPFEQVGNANFEVLHTSCYTKEFLSNSCCATSYSWDFGDGGVDSTRLPNHTFASAGTYTIRLIVDGDTTYRIVKIGIDSTDLIVHGSRFICENGVTIGYSVRSDSTFDYTWTATNGNLLPMGSRADVLWNDTGRLKVVINQEISGCKDSSTISIAQLTTTLDFNYTITDCYHVTFNSNNPCFVNTWDLGDGTTSNSPNLEHDYFGNGTFEVSLIVNGDTVIKTLTLGFPIENLAISGKESFCGDSMTLSHSTASIVGATYLWSVQYGSITTATQHEITSSWDTLGSLKIVIIDSTGCTDSASLQITKTEDDILGFKYKIKNCDSVFFSSTGYCDSMYKWNFGDNGISTLPNPIHVYQDTGSFLVQLIMRFDTVSQWVKVGEQFPTFQILGPDSFCDRIAKVYGVMPSGYYSYIWNANGNTLSVKFPQASVSWSNGGILSVEVIAINSGCRDTVERVITKFNNIYNQDITPFYQQHCNNLLVDTLKPSLMPIGGDGSFSYLWFKKSLYSGSATFDTIQNETSPMYFPVSSGIYVRKTYSAFCDASSTPVTAAISDRANLINYIGDLCAEGSSITLLGNELPFNLYPNSSETYKWQQKVGAGNWVDISATTKDLAVITTSQSIKYRRITFAQYDTNYICIDTSNIIDVYPTLAIAAQPIPILTCTSSPQNWTSSVSVNNPSLVSRYYLQIKFSNTSNWSNWLENTTGFFTINPGTAGVNVSQNDSIRFIVVPTTNCGSIVSDAVVINTITSSVSFTTHPIDFNGVVKGNSFFNCTNNSVGALSQTWQYKSGYSWFDLFSEPRDTLSFYIPNICDKNREYRKAVTHYCGTAYSNSATLYLTDPSDIWMRDGYNDVGTEPNPDSTHYEIVRSPDIWNRDTVDGLQGHQNMEFKNLSPNQLNVMVRNKGTDTTQTTPLFLYWTLGQINNEEWDLRWLDKPGNKIWNATLSDSFPIGSRINPANAPIMVPPIPPNDSIQVSYNWYPPNPAWYSSLVPNDSRGVSICLLARLEHCDVYPYGMKYNEVFNQHVKVNVINNNNIITRNTWVADIDPDNMVDHDDDGDIDWIGGSWTGMGRPDPVGSEIKPCFDALTPSFFTHWRVAIEVDDVVRDAILVNSPNNPDIEYIGNNIFALDEVGVKCIPNIVLFDNDLHFFRPLFSPIAGWANLPQQYYEVGMTQYNHADVVDGAGSFILDNTNGAFNNIQYANSNTTIVETNHLLLSPNPTSGQFQVELDEDTKNLMMGQFGMITVADGYGYPHVMIQNIGAGDITQINLSGYKAGLYNVRYEIGGQVFYKYVVKTDE